MIEVEHRRIAVVLADQIDDRDGQPVFLPQRHAVAHVRDEDLRRHLRLGVVVRVLAHLVLLEVVGALELADVMIVCAHAHEQRVRSDGLRRGLGNVGDDDRVVIGARRLDHQPAQQRLVGVGQLQQLGGRHQVERGLQQRLDAHADDGGHKAAQRGEERAVEHGLDVVVRQDAHAQHNAQIAHAHQQAGDEQAHARGAPAQRIDARRAAHDARQRHGDRLRRRAAAQAQRQHGHDGCDREIQDIRRGGADEAGRHQRAQRHEDDVQVQPDAQDGQAQRQDADDE